MVVVVERRLFGSVGKWIPAKIRRCWSVRIPFVVLRLVLTLSMVSVGSAFEGDNLPREGLDEDLHVKIRRCWLVWIPSLSSILFLTLSMASVDSATKAIVFPVRILTKICICFRCRRRLFGSPEDVVVLETHVLSFPFFYSPYLPSLRFLTCFSHSPSVSYALTPWHFPHLHPRPQWLGCLVDSERRQQPPSLLDLVAVCGEPPPAGASPRA